MVVAECAVYAVYLSDRNHATSLLGLVLGGRSSA